MATDQGVRPPYGLQYVIPAGARAAWGARLIVTQDGHVDLVPDRQGADGGDAERPQLLDLLNEKLPITELRALIRDLLLDGAMDTRKAEDFILFMDDAIIIHANTNASAGYCYVTAWLHFNAPESK